MPRSQRPARDQALLLGLLTAVQRARVTVRSGRQLPATFENRSHHHQACATLATAMEAYADAAAASGVPLPYRYRDEMRLYRSMAKNAPPPSATGRAEPRRAT